MIKNCSKLLFIILFFVSILSPLSAFSLNSQINSSGKIIFVSDRDTTKEIYMMDDTGSNQKRITINSYGNWSPSWSPVGNRLVFYSNRDGNFQIYTMLNDGADQKRLRRNGFSETSPVWSPQGDKIAFISDAMGSECLWVMSADGTSATVLNPNDKGCNSPAWSPDGTKIAFQKKVGVHNGLAIVPVKGGPEEMIMSGEADYDQPAWSPDGEVLAYVVTKGIWMPSTKEVKTISNIFVAQAKDSWKKQKKITFQGNNSHPCWYPDGEKIVFQSDRKGYWALYESTPDGQHQKKITESMAIEQTPQVSPDGKKIAFTYHLYKASQISILETATGEVLNITNPAYDHVYPHWSTNPEEFVYTSFEKKFGSISRANISGVIVDSEESVDGDQLGPMETPDQKFYVYSWSSNGNGQIVLMDKVTRKTINLSNNNFDERNPSVTFDGSQIFFDSNRSGKYQIYRINIDGTFPTVLSDSKANDRHPVLSPDMTTVVFYSDRDGNAEIYTLNLNTHALTRLTNNSAWDGDPSWSPEGDSIVFVSNRDSRFQIYKMKADGTNLINLSNDPWNDLQPFWH